MEMSYDKLREVTNSYLSLKDIEKVHKAYLFAALAHDGQLRKSGEPYIIHPIFVTHILAKQNLPTTVLIAGLLHDVVEDTEITDKDIRDIFGTEVADIVAGVTKLGNIAGLSNDQVQAANHRKIILATADDVRVILVKLADRVHNMQTIKYMNESKQKTIAHETLEVYAPIAHRLGMYGMKWELEDLSFRCINRDAYDEIANKLNMKRSERDKFVKEVVDNAVLLLEKYGIKAHVYGRTKHIYSIYTSMKRRKKSFEELTDLFAFRIVVESIPQCYSVLGIIHENFKPIPLRFKDYIPTPKHNMYQSIHTTVLTASGVFVEFQIRTKEMERVAEHGIAAHWTYKENLDTNAVQEDVNTRLSWLKKAANDIEYQNSSQFMTAVKEDYLSKTLIVYTPKGDVIELPLGSKVLDFAYYIHSNVGNKALSAKVNDIVVSLFYPLNIGDVVQVITSDIVEPSISSIHKVKTSRARDSLKKYFKDAEKENIRNEGYKVLVEFGLERNIENIRELLKEENLNHVFNRFDIYSLDEILYEVGIGDISINEVFNILVNDKKTMDTDDKLIVNIKGAEKNHSHRICRYCSPIPGDEIIASKNIDSINDEYIIHRDICKRITNKYSVSWTGYASKVKYIVRLRIILLDEPTSVARLLTKLTKNNSNITSIYFRAGLDTTAMGKVSLEIHSLKEFDSLYDELIKLDNVQEIIRILK